MQHLPRARVPDQVGEQVRVVGHGVVVEPAQRGVRSLRGPRPGLRPDRVGVPQPAAEHRQRTARVGQQHPQAGEPLEHPGHRDVRRGHRGLQRVAHRVPQVVVIQGGNAEAAGGRVDEHERPGARRRLPERQEEVIAQVPAADAGRDLDAAQSRGEQAGQFPGGQAREPQRHRADRAQPPGPGRHHRGQGVVLHLAHQPGLVLAGVHRDQVDPGRQQQVIHAGGVRLGQHHVHVAELGHHRGRAPGRGSGPGAARARSGARAATRPGPAGRSSPAR